MDETTNGITLMKCSALILVFYLIFISGCSDSGSNTSGANMVFPDKNVSFQNQVQPFIKIKCSIYGCHGDVNPPREIRLTDYASFFASYNGALVIPGKPEASVLVQMLENKLPHNPNVYWEVNDNQKKGIRQWILEGAQNN